jgi:ectoine hydroxylase-related dioxygenase (phytanoyl-CoA dioxygenase family)
MSHAARLVDGNVREVTDDEARFFWQNGWLKVEQLISAALAAELLGRVQRRMGRAGDEHRARPDVDFSAGLNWWNEYRHLAREDEVAAALTRAPQIGRSAEKLFRRPAGVRLGTDLVLCKMPHGESEATDWHQDGPIYPFDRMPVSFWIALNDIPPERGPMRFHTGSHKWGPLGRSFVASGSPRDHRIFDSYEGQTIFDAYPWIEDECPLSPPLHLRAGDATVHHPYVIHGAPQNLTTEPRWAYVFAAIPADTLYSGAPYHSTDGLGLEVGKPLDHPNFPLVYPSDDPAVPSSSRIS